MISTETKATIAENHTGNFNHVAGVSIERKELEMEMRLQATEWLYSNRYAWGHIYLNQLIDSLVKIAVSENWTPPAEDFVWPPVEIEDSDKFLAWMDPIFESAKNFYSYDPGLADLLGYVGNWLGWRAPSVA